MSTGSGSDLLIATGNPGKVTEIQSALEGLPLRLFNLKEYPHILAPAESGSSYEENAILKARSYANQIGLRALADDSGLEVDALDGAPGLRSARFGGEGASDADRIDLLLSRLARIEDAKREATFICVVAIVEPSGVVVHTTRGICKGRIASAPAGDRGFGYDPVFVPDGYEVSFAELPLLLKNRISHRGKALALTRQFLRGHLEGRLTAGRSDS